MGGSSLKPQLQRWFGWVVLLQNHSSKGGLGGWLSFKTTAPKVETTAPQVVWVACPYTLPCKWWCPFIWGVEKAMSQVGKMYLLRSPVLVVLSQQPGGHRLQNGPKPKSEMPWPSASAWCYPRWQSSPVFQSSP